MEATEYALKKIVRNNTIVREIDEVRQREMWQWVCISLVFVVVVLVTVGLQVYFVQRGYEVAALQRERAAEEENSRQLLLDIERLRSPQRIAPYALGTLHMVEPPPGQAVVIERVVPAPRPSAAVVASAR